MQDKITTQDARLKDLICHRMGMMTFQGDFMYWNSKMTRAEVVNHFGKINPKYPFRTKYGYCNAGFTTAGECILAATAKSWEEHIQEKIFSPIGMTASVALQANLKNIANKTSGHSFLLDKLVTVPYANLDNLAAAASISSNLVDMCKWMQCWLDSGKVNNKNVIDYNTMRKVLVGNTVVSSNKNKLFASRLNMYGLGFFLEDYASNLMVSHTGGVDGYVTSVTMIPEKKLGIVVLTNTDQNQFFESVKYQLLDMYLNKASINYDSIFYKAWKNSFEEQNIQTKKDIKKANENKAILNTDILGIYTNEMYGAITLKNINKKCMVSFEHHLNLSAELQIIENDKYLCTFNDPMFGIHTIDIKKNTEGKLTIPLKVNDFLEFEPYFFVKE